jgi:hypothetical protein
MQSAENNVSHDQHLDAVKELGTNMEHQGYFDKVQLNVGTAIV